MKIGKFILSSCATNCYFVYEEGSKDVIFFDPGDEGGLIYNKLKEAGFNVAAIYLTHGHFDHMEGGNELRELSGAKIYCLAEEEEICKDPMLNLSGTWGISHSLTPDELLHDGQECEAAGLKFKVIATPGHTKGGCCFYFEKEGVLIGGDTLFYESVGRYDFPTSSGRDLLTSIKEKLFVLPDETKVYPGHGEATTIGHEKEFNPCV